MQQILLGHQLLPAEGHGPGVAVPVIALVIGDEAHGDPRHHHNAVAEKKVAVFPGGQRTQGKGQNHNKKRAKILFGHIEILQK